MTDNILFYLLKDKLKQFNIIIEKPSDIVLKKERINIYQYLDIATHIKYFQLVLDRENVLIEWNE